MTILWFMDKLPTGSRILDKMLNEGYEKDIITTLYGPAGSGKTNLCILCAINTARSGKKIIYVDTENNFSLERFKQICSSINLNYAKILNNIVFLRPASFEEQKKTFEKLKALISSKIGLIIIDSIAKSILDEGAAIIKKASFSLRSSTFFTTLISVSSIP